MGASSSVVNNTSSNQFDSVMPSSMNKSGRVKLVKSQTINKMISEGVNGLTESVAKRMNATPSKTPSNQSMETVEEAEDNHFQTSSHHAVEHFSDSIYVPQWLSNQDADALFDCLATIGEKHRPLDTLAASKTHSKYPLWTKYYGLQRSKDGARALDRWGSYHESWLRVEEPPLLLKQCAEKLKQSFPSLHNSEFAVNSRVVNYYFDGASRSFLLCENEDAGKYRTEDMNKVHKTWHVQHGDLFGLGSKTNQDYCHAVPQESALKEMRISIIFRSVDKCFVDCDAERVIDKEARYSNGKKKVFQAECVTVNEQEEGKNIVTKEQRLHLADMINQREQEKLDKKQLLANKTRYELECQAQNNKADQSSAADPVFNSYYMGCGVAVPNQ